MRQKMTGASDSVKEAASTVEEVVPLHTVLEINGDQPLNLPQLEQLYGAEDMRDLLGSFIRETSALLVLIDRYCKEKNSQDLAAQVHQLKGLASVMTGPKCGPFLRTPREGVERTRLGANFLFA